MIWSWRASLSVLLNSEKWNYHHNKYYVGCGQNDVCNGKPRQKTVRIKKQPKGCRKRFHSLCLCFLYKWSARIVKQQILKWSIFCGMAHSSRRSRYTDCTEGNFEVSIININSIVKLRRCRSKPNKLRWTTLSILFPSFGPPKHSTCTTVQIVSAAVVATWYARWKTKHSYLVWQPKPY